MKATKIAAPKQPLPDGITVEDLQQPDWDKDEQKGVAWDDRDFELWFTRTLGWCIPTLAIGSSGSRSGRVGAQRRTYAVMVPSGKLCRIGSGPHVLETAVVYVRAKRHAALKTFLDLRTKGLADAGQTRDRISSRRAQGQMEREAGKSYWRWDT